MRQSFRDFLLVAGRRVADAELSDCCCCGDGGFNDAVIHSHLEERAPSHVTARVTHKGQLERANKSSQQKLAQ